MKKVSYKGKTKNYHKLLEKALAKVRSAFAGGLL